MNPKTKRIAAIRNLIDGATIASQDQLLEQLNALGFEATQSTLSRDLKFMNVVKVHTDDGYTYMLPDKIINRAVHSTSSVITDNVLGIEFSANLCIIKTKSGYANAVTVIIDNHAFDEVAGTLAGDDTILLILRENASREQFASRLKTLFPNL